MKINKECSDGVLTLQIEGRLDTVTAPELEGELAGSLDGVNELVLDFSKLEYISSAGLRVLLSAQKTMRTRGGMKVTNVKDRKSVV